VSPDAAVTERGLRVARGGRGERLFVLLHGMGATSAVWEPIVPLIEASGDGRWVAPDLRGHGASAHRGPYGVATHAADVAELIAGERAEHVTLAGHSFGGVVAALVATGWFGPRVREVAAFGVKLRWTEAEVSRARELAVRPARVFATREEAVDRHLRLAGLSGLVDPGSPIASAGVVEGADGFRVALDPRVFEAVGPSVERLLGLAEAPLRLAAGEKDPMVTLDQMRGVDAGAHVFPGVGHNAHWEAPEPVWRFIAGGR
jgi:pimeloyl-ACP methyl ester carboxylesterase